MQVQVLPPRSVDLFAVSLHRLPEKAPSIGAGSALARERINTERFPPYGLPPITARAKAC